MSPMPDHLKKRYVSIPKPTPDPQSENPPYWHSRGYLPHNENWEKIQMLTYRLGDALPLEVAERLANEPHTVEGEAHYRKRIEAYLDAGHGSCCLRINEIAKIVYDSFLHFDGKHYDLDAFVIMPNHVHLLFEPIAPFTLSIIIGDWKSFTSRSINHILKKRGSLWQTEYFDRYIRDRKHYENALKYIRGNPVKARLVKKWEQWPWTYVKETILKSMSV